VSYDETKEHGSSASVVLDANVRPRMGGILPLSVEPLELPMSDPVSLERFYADVLFELGEFARRPSATAIGAAVVVKRVAKAHGLEVADRLPLPRFNRAERESRSDSAWVAGQ